MGILRVGDDFEQFARKLQGQIKRMSGMNVPMPEITDAMADVLGDLDFNFDFNAIPKSKEREIIIKIKRRKGL